VSWAHEEQKSFGGINYTSERICKTELLFPSLIVHMAAEFDGSPVFFRMIYGPVRNIYMVFGSAHPARRTR
jgi:hypothetical protein